MVVTTATVERKSQPNGGDGFRLIEQVVDSVFFSDSAAFTIDHVIAVKTSGQAAFIGGIWNQISCDLPEGKCVVRQVSIECFSHPVAPWPHGAFAVTLIAVCICITGGIEPVPSHAFTVAWVCQ